MTVKELVDILADYTKIKIEDDVHKKYFGEFMKEPEGLIPKFDNNTKADDVLYKEVTLFDIDTEYIHEYDCFQRYLYIFVK